MYLCLLGVVAFAVWQASVFVRGVGAGPAPRPAGLPAGRPAAGEAPSQPASGPVGAEDAGLHDLDGDPAGLPPPPGARRRDAYWRLAEGCREEIALYELSGETGAAAEHYLAAFAGAGLSLLSDRADGTGARRLCSVRGPVKAVVTLRKAAAAEKMIRITVIVTAPAGEAPRPREGEADP